MSVNRAENLSDEIYEFTQNRLLKKMYCLDNLFDYRLMYSDISIKGLGLKIATKRYVREYDRRGNSR